MKKVILTFALFSLVVLTSFTTTETQTQNMVVETGDTGGGQSIGGDKKLNDSDTGGGQSIGGNKKLEYMEGIDTGGGQSIGGNKKLE